MKKLTFITSSILAFLAVTAFAFNRLNKEPKTHCCKPPTEPLEATSNFDLQSIIGDTQQKPDNLFYSVIRKHFISVTKAELNNAKYIDELIPDYPSNWIDEYKQATMTFVHKGKEEKIVSPDNKLNSKQQALLRSLDANDHVTIQVNYQTRNMVTDEPEDGGIRVSIGIKPATEANFPEGYENLITYLKENSQDEIRALKPNKTPEAQIEFTINEKGKIIDVELVESSQNEKIDQLLLQLIQKMPDWKPALDENGYPISQKFEFRLGEDMC